ncbi:MAG: hypothetical protein ACO3JL_15705 [Myxococcota bacterium]
MRTEKERRDDNGEGLKFLFFPLLIIGLLIAGALSNGLVLVLLAFESMLNRARVAWMYVWALVRVPLLLFAPLTAAERASFAWVRARRWSGRRFLWNGKRFWLPVAVRGRILGSITFKQQLPETVGYDEHWVEYTTRTVTVHGFLTRWFIPRVHLESSWFLIGPHGCKAGEDVVVIYDQVGLRHVVLPSHAAEPRQSKVMSAFREGYVPSYDDQMDDEATDS